ncbi:MAG: internal scaffolding protein [Arizlama microvirus]|nr:MAG: internal scaffolding protein [Arizlama microvirus]
MGRNGIGSWIDYSKEDSDAAVTVNTDPSLTHQEFKDECDINCIMNTFAVTGMPPPAGYDKPPMYGDFTDVPDFLEYKNTVLEAKESFDTLPDSIRKNFKNYSTFVGWLENATYEDAVNIGLIEVPPQADKVAKEAVSD